jgi:uncharacterized protein YcnI
MSARLSTVLRLGGWLGVSLAGAFLARAAVYSFASAQTPLAARLEGAAGGPSLTIEIVVCALAVVSSIAIVGTAAVAVAERRQLEPFAQSSSGRIEPLRVVRHAVTIFVTSSLVFAIVESYLHWRAGLGLHGLRCLTGPVHRDAIPFLAALSSLAAAGISAGGHVVSWLRRTIARLVGHVANARPQLRRRLRPASSLVISAPASARAHGPRGPPPFLVRPAGANPANERGERMHVSRTRRAGALALAAVGASIFVNDALAHAVVSPPVAKAKASQVFTLAVPTEEENATTTTIELTPPQGFSIDSFAPAPGWKRNVQETGEGEDAVIQKVTWSGGHVPTEEDANFQFIATADSAKTYSFSVRQTYSNGKVVDWSGPESSDTPAPIVLTKSSLGGGGPLLAIIALVVGGVGVLLGLAGLFAGRRALA